jgi:hypothetical protein
LEEAEQEVDKQDDAVESEEVMMIEVTWMQPYLAYLINKKLPKDVVEARRIAWCSKAFAVVNTELYKRIISDVLQRCVTTQEGQAILKEIHASMCGHHASSRATTTKAFRAGFYWLSSVEDAKDIVHCFNACQRFASKPHTPPAKL